MKKPYVVGALCALALLPACKSPGRITIAEINSLEPAQMRALAVSDAYVFQSDMTTAARADPAEEPATAKEGIPWLDAVKAVVGAKWRVSCVKIEWGRPAATSAK